MGLAEIQHAIEELPAEQQASLAVWLSERDRLRWDLELERDFSAGGAGMTLLRHPRLRLRSGNLATEGQAGGGITEQIDRAKTKRQIEDICLFSFQGVISLP